MPDFNLLKTPDYFGGAVNALQAGQQALQTRERRNALSTYGTDPAGARNALLGIGDVETAGQLQGMENSTAQLGFAANRDARDAAQDVRAAGANKRAAQEADDRSKEAHIKQAAALNGAMLNAVAAVASRPEAERDAYFASTVAPELARQGVPKESLDRIAGSKKDDATLQSYGQLLGKEKEEIYQFLGLDNGGVARANKRTGQVDTVIQPHPEYRSVGQGDELVELPSNGAAPAPGAGGQPRGLRNNNPGNIEDGAFAKGLPGYKGSDGRFAIFDSPQAGDNAAVSLLQSYGTRGFDTIGEIVNRWAPASDGNPTPAYIDFVSKRVGVAPDEQLNLAKPEVAIKVAQAIKAFENGAGSPSNGGAKVVATGAKKPGYRPATPEEVVGVGLPAGTPAQVSPDGKIEPLPAGASLKALPATIGKNLADTKTSIGRIDRALEELTKYPKGVGLQNVIGDTIMQRADKKGVDVRAFVANVGSQLIHDRSGAAVTISETPRLKPFVPDVRDDAATVRKKLGQLRDILQTDLENVQGEFSQEAGYRQGADRAPATTPQAGSLPPQAVSSLKAGHNTTFANGQVWTLRDGKPVKVN